MNKTYKAEIGVQPVQFDFIHFEVEGTPEEIRMAYQEMRSGVAAFGAGVSEKDFRELYDKVAQGKPIQGDPGMLDSLNWLQKNSLNDVKKFVARNTK